jgi:hypothetical protein
VPVVDDNSADTVRLRLAGGEAETRVRPSGESKICVFCQGFFLLSPGDKNLRSLKTVKISTDREVDSSALMAFDGVRSVLRSEDSELLLIELPNGRCKALHPRNATAPEEFTAAAVSQDGRVVARFTDPIFIFGVKRRTRVLCLSHRQLCRKHGGPPLQYHLPGSISR